jgi:hypothetical protein
MTGETVTVPVFGGAPSANENKYDEVLDEEADEPPRYIEISPNTEGGALVYVTPTQQVVLNIEPVLTTSARDVPKPFEAST